jgi:hypothetical protein
MRGYPYTVGLAITLVMMTVFEKAQALDVPYDEWEVLFREALLAETALLRGRMPSAARAA